MIATVLFSFGNCTPAKKVTNSCSTEGTVKDMTGLDGCKMMIVLEDGNRLNPIEYPETFQLKDGQKIRFSYEEIDQANICMSGQTVRITCIELQ